jgi:hypothetical protein
MSMMSFGAKSNLVFFVLSAALAVSARADVIYDFSGTEALFPGTESFQYTAPNFITADISIPGSSLDFCTVSGTLAPPCDIVNFFISGPDSPQHYPEIAFETGPTGVPSILDYYFPSGNFGQAGTIQSPLGNTATLTIASVPSVPEPSSLVLLLVAIFGLTVQGFRWRNGFLREGTPPIASKTQ